MADSESIKNSKSSSHAVMVAFRDTETGPQPATTPNHPDTQTQRHGELLLETPNWDAQDRYLKLLTAN